MYLLPLLWVAGVVAEEVGPFEKPDCDPEMLKEFEETPKDRFTSSALATVANLASKVFALGQHYIGDYVAIDLPDVEAEHRRVRRGGAGAGGSTGRHPFKMSFEGYGRTFDLRMESNVKKLFHNDLQIIVNSANGTQSKLGLKDIDTSVFYGGYLERGQRSSEVTAHIDRGVLVAHIHTNPPFSNILYRGSDLPQNATEALHGSFEGVNENDPQFMERFYQTRNATHRRRTRHKRGGTAFQERRADGNYNMDEYNTCFVNVAGGDLQRAISLMTQNTAGATLIYRYSNFYHSVGKGVHFAIKRFQIFETEGAAGNPFANPADFACGAEGDESALCTRDTPCGLRYLNMFSLWGGGENEFNDVTGPCYPFQFSRQKRCNGDKNFCRTDGCTGSLCSGWPMTNISGGVPSAAWLAEGTNAQARAEPCRLTFIDQNVEVAENVGKECHTSCQQIAASGSFEAVTLITREPGMSCYYKKDMFAGRCRQVNDNGFVVVACGSAGSSVTVEIDPQAVKRWIKENWGVAVGLIVGGITIKSRNKTSDNHHATEHAKVPVTSKRHQLLKKRLKASQAIKRLEAFFPGAKRDNVDFKAIVQKVENERQAIKKLLNQGYQFLVPSKVPLLES
eukprot:gene8542-25681_t